MMMDIKWAREFGIGTFVVPAFSSIDPRLEDWFLPASEPPFDINYALFYNPDTDFDPKSQDPIQGPRRTLICPYYSL